MEIDFKSVHKKCGWHEDAILKSKECGCFYCLKIFPPKEITEWIDESKDSTGGIGKTAICPYCGIDSDLPDSIDHKLTEEFF